MTRVSRRSAWTATRSPRRTFRRTTYGGFLVEFAGQFVVDQHLLDAGEAGAWAGEQRALAERGDFYFACIQFCFAAKRPR